MHKKLKNYLKELEDVINESDFWSNQENANKITTEMKRIQKKLDHFFEIEKELKNIEELNGRDLINKEIIRLSSLIYNTYYLDDKNKESKDEEYVNMIKNFVVATDNFVVYRPSFALYTVLAGYHWFLDWGRDTLIAFEGVLLKTKRYKEAKEVLLTCIRDIRFGLVPNRIFWI